MSNELFAFVTGLITWAVFAIARRIWPKADEASAETKRLVVVGSAVAGGLLTLGLSCLPQSFAVPWRPEYSCDVAGGSAIIVLAASSLGGSQAAYTVGKVLGWLMPIVARWITKTGEAPK